jgi:serine/threonine protein kinase
MLTHPSQSECPFIVRTYGAFHDQRQIYFVLEYVPGGELFSYMRQKGRFPEADAAFYSAQVVMALEVCGKMATWAYVS